MDISDTEVATFEDDSDDLDKYLETLSNCDCSSDENSSNHSCSKKTKCPFCGIEFWGPNWKPGLKKHILSVHEKVRYSCDFCERDDFSDEFSFIRHMKKAHPNEEIRSNFKELTQSPEVLSSSEVSNFQFHEIFF